MLPFTQEIITSVDTAALVYGTTFESRLRHELDQICTAQGLGQEREAQASVLRDAFPALRSEDFEVSNAATVTVMKLLYELSEVIPPEYFEAALRGDEDTALYRLFFQVKPAPNAVIVNDWLYDVMWDKPGSIITYSEGEGRFYLVRPNSLCRLSIEAQFLGSLPCGPQYLESISAYPGSRTPGPAAVPRRKATRHSWRTYGSVQKLVIPSPPLLVGFSFGLQPGAAQAAIA